MSKLPDLYLASRSPRRRELLEQLSINYQVITADVPEEHQLGESPENYVKRLALEKAQAGWQKVPENAKCPVLGSDTVVVLGGEILEKPKDRSHGLQMLERLSGHTHQVMTGIALVAEDQALSRVSISRVTFRDTTPAEREAYWATGEPADKAGGYAVQGMAAVFIERIEGSYSGIMGLSLYELCDMLAQFRIKIFK